MTGSLRRDNAYGQQRATPGRTPEQVIKSILSANKCRVKPIRARLLRGLRRRWADALAAPRV